MSQIRITTAAVACVLTFAGCVGDSEPSNDDVVPTNPATTNNSMMVGSVRPVVIDICSNVSAEQVTELVGVLATQESDGVTDNSSLCTWRTADDRLPQMSLSLRSNAEDDREEFERQLEADTFEIIPVPWSPDGEMRVIGNMFTGEPGAVQLWAYVINTDALGRDVWIEASFTRPVDDQDQPIGDIEDIKTAVLELGELLSTATRDAQPEGVMLPDISE